MIFQHFWTVTSPELLSMFPNQLYRLGQDIPHISKRTVAFNRAKCAQNATQKGQESHKTRGHAQHSAPAGKDIRNLFPETIPEDL